MEFYVGVFQNSHFKYVPSKCNLSYRRILARKSLFDIPKNLKWILDSGAYQELKLNGKYTYTPEEYFKKVVEYQPTYFVNMDYMCEPWQIRKTGLSIKKHQELSLENQIKLDELAESENLELMGTIQGWSTLDYLQHIDLLKEHGEIRPLMGIGSVCRRNAENEIIKILRCIRKELPSWVKLHGFGIKTSILRYREVYDILHSCDSMAWSFKGRKEGEQRVGRGGSLFGKPCLINDKYICQKHTDDCADCGLYMQNWVENIEEIIRKNELQSSLEEYLEVPLIGNNS